MTASNPSPEKQQSGCGLYVHLPYCTTKCGYCDFFSVPLGDRDPQPVVESVMAELGSRVGACRDRVRTVFVGGGTPTVLPTELLRSILSKLRSIVPVGDLAEYTVEANPATVDEAKVKMLLDEGVTRVSMGAQSFDPAELATLERIHNPEDILLSMEVLRRAGMGQINLDLIFGISGQTIESWKRSLRRAIDLQPDHIACYGLTYEAGTRLHAQRARGSITPCDEGIEAEMYILMVETLVDAGYEQYETSNFAKPGCRSEHNLTYWKNGPFIGVGPSAAGFADGRRYKNVSEIAAYIRQINERGHAEAESESVDREKLIIEMVMMQLRLIEGLSVADFRARIGVDPRTLFKRPLQRIVEAEMCVVTETHISLTLKGRLVSDAIMAELVAESDTVEAT